MTKKTLRDLSRKEIKSIAVDYSTQWLIPTINFINKYNISETTFYNALRKAVVEGIVDEETVSNMEARAMNSAYLKAGLAGKKRSWKHYENLRSKRENFSFSNKDAKRITVNFINSNETVTDYAKRIVITDDLLQWTFDDSINKKLLSEEEVALLNMKRYS